MKIINNKIFKSLVLIFVLGILLGVISYFILGLKNSNIINYFETLKNERFNYSIGLFNSIKYNYKYIFFIWIFGIIFILSIFIPFIVCFRGFSVGFTISLIIYTFKIKGLLYAVILLFPCIIINELIYLLQSYYSINFSIKIFKAFKYNKTITLKYFFKNYVYRVAIFLIILTISSLFEIYITSNIIKFVL